MALAAVFLSKGFAMDDVYAKLPDVPEGHKVAILAGGCFWCLEPPFDQVDGVIATTSGYIGGEIERPSYAQIGTGRTGHAEAVHVIYDPEKVTYKELLDVFWRSIDPTDGGGQFADRGTQYRTSIFVIDDEQRAIAEASLKDFDENGPFDDPIRTLIEEATEFYPAEEYHQDYYKKQVLHYNRYKVGSGRAGFLEALGKQILG